MEETKKIEQPENKKIEQPEQKMIKVTVEGEDGLQEYEGTAVFVLAMRDNADGGVHADGKTEGWFNDVYLMAMQKILEENFPNWHKAELIRMTRRLARKMFGDDEDKAEDAEAPESDPAE